MSAGAQTESGYVRVLDLARGGMGYVQLAVKREGGFERLYAVKRLHKHFQEDADLRGQFLDEGRVAGLMRHANIVSVLDVGEDSEGPYLVMGYIEGVTVSDFVKWHVKNEQSPPIQFVLQIASDAAKGLHAAHELRRHDGTPMNLVHRDVSPQNLIIGFDGVTRVTDFGIAKALGRSTQTRTGVLKGKLGYMSPEQLRFRPPTRKSDIFSLGIVLFELFSARRLYKSAEGELEPWRILEDPTPDIGEHRTDVPPKIVALLFRMLGKEPDGRPETVKEVADVVSASLAQEIVDNGALELDSFLQDVFGDRRTSQRSRVESAVQKTKIDLVPLAETKILEVSRDKRTQWPLLAILGGAIVAASAGIGFALANQGADSVAPTVSPERVAPPNSNPAPPTLDLAPPTQPEAVETEVEDEAADPEPIRAVAMGERARTIRGRQREATRMTARSVSTIMRAATPTPSESWDWGMAGR